MYKEYINLGPKLMWDLKKWLKIPNDGAGIVVNKNLK